MKQGERYGRWKSYSLQVKLLVVVRVLVRNLLRQSLSGDTWRRSALHNDLCAAQRELAPGLTISSDLE